MESMSSQITEDDIAAYERDGVVCLRGAFGPDWISVMQGAVDAAMASPGPFAEEYADAASGGRFFGDLDVWRRQPDFRMFVLSSPAAEIAGRIMRARSATFFYDQLLVKEGGTPNRTPWHQDQPYWAVSGRQVASVWAPFDPVPEDVSVEYIAGSHLWSEHNPHNFLDGSPYQGTDLPPLPDIESERDKHRILRFAMRPGDDRSRRARKPLSGPPPRSCHPLARPRRALPQAQGPSRHPDKRSGLGRGGAVWRGPLSRGLGSPTVIVGRYSR